MLNTRRPLTLHDSNGIGLDYSPALAPGRHWLDDYHWHVNDLAPLIIDEIPP
jgi:hypothetical protein